MIRYVINRVLLLIPVIIAVSLIVFTLLELAPGTIVDTMIDGDMTQEEVDALMARFNLDRSMFYRYGLYMQGLVRGDLGISQGTGLSVFDTYMERLPNTLILAFTTAVIGVALSIPLGIRAARKAGTITDAATTAFSLVGMSMPNFWLGLLLILLFSHHLGWLPTGGNREGWRSLILPAFTAASTLMAMSARQTRSSMLEVLRADFMRTARAKGVPERTVIRKHALGNALIPIITVVGTSLCVSLAGSVVVEQVFAWPGVGRMLIEGVRSRDVTVTLGCVLMTTILYVLIMLIVDLLYAFVDPRIKSQYMTGKRKRKRAGAVIVVPVISGAGQASEAPETVYSTAGGAGAETASAAKQTDEDMPESSNAQLPHLSSYARNTSGSDEPGVHVTNARSFATRRDEDIVITDKAVDVAEVIAKYKKRSQFGDLMHRLVRNKSSLAGMIILGFVFVVAIASLFMTFSSVTASNVPARFSSPSWQFPFGTDNMGRNLFLRVIYGTRYSVVIGFSAVAISAFVGVILGSMAGYYGGKTDNIIMRISDTLASIPSLLLGMVIMIMLGLQLQNLIIAVGIGGIPHFIRMSRASILTVKGNEYVEAARAIGFSDLRIIVTQVLPNGLSPIIVQATMSLGITIIIASSLSFLGFGVPAPTPEWGALIAAGREFARSAPWLMTFPGLAIMVTVLGFNLLGDGLRDALDPKLKK